MKISDLDYICPKCCGWLMSSGFRSDRAEYICSQCKFSISYDICPICGNLFSEGITICDCGYKIFNLKNVAMKRELKLKEREIEFLESSENIQCPLCGSIEVASIRKGDKKQIYVCKMCGWQKVGN